MLDWLLGVLGTFNPSSAPLEFVVDETDDGRFAVSVHAESEDGTRHPVDPRKVSRYGARLRANGEDIPIDTEDFELLLSLRDRDPEYTDGQAIFPAYPPELEYLRTRGNVSQTDAVEKLEVHSEPARPEANVDFDPETGATVEMRLQDADDESWPLDESTSALPGWRRLGNAFYREPDVSDATAEWLESGEHEVPLDEVPEFFARDLALLRSDFGAVLTDRAQRVDIATADDDWGRTVQVRRGDSGWLDFDIEYDAGDVRLSHDQVKDFQGAGLTRVDPWTWAEIDDDKVQETERALDDLDPIEEEDGFRIAIEQFQSLEDFISSLGGKREIDAAYQEFLAGIEDFEADSEFSPPEPIVQRLYEHEIRLRDYQREAIHWLDWLGQNHLHGLLADDMGLGKTLQALVALAGLYERFEVERPSLIVAPLSVKGHWRDEAKKVFARNRIRVYHGQSRKSADIARRAPNIVISTYGTVRNDAERISRYPLFALILDEATKIKNPNQTTRAIKSLNAKYRLALSGTPIENHLGELWSIFDFLIPGPLGSRGSFRRKFRVPIEEEQDEKVLAELQGKIEPFFTRRTKDDVAQELPEKVTMHNPVELTDEQAALYGQIQDQHKDQREQLLEAGKGSRTTSVLQALMRLKQVCVHPALIDGVDNEPVSGRSEKFDGVVELARRIVDEGEQVVIFSQFLKPLDLLQRTLGEIQQIRIDGQTRNRQELIDGRFNPGHAKIALCSTMAASHGLNLQAANHVIHVDYWWNPAIKRQATDRVHRIGQKRTVYSHEFWVEGTLEEKIRSLLAQKQELADQVITSEVSSIVSALTAEELAELLRPVG